MAAFLPAAVPVALDDCDSPLFCEQLNWTEHVAELNKKESPNGLFLMCNMYYPSYMKLCPLIDPAVQKHIDMANRKTGNFHHESTTIGVNTTPALHCCICWLAGGSHHDIHLTAGKSSASFKIYAHRCISAINECDDLAFKFPSTPNEVERAAQDFKSINSYDVIEGCIAAMDGILIKIQVPENLKLVMSGLSFLFTTMPMG